MKLLHEMDNSELATEVKRRFESGEATLEVHWVIHQPLEKHSFVIDKTRYEIAFIDETETSVRLQIQRKAE